MQCLTKLPTVVFFLHFRLKNNVSFRFLIKRQSSHYFFWTTVCFCWTHKGNVKFSEWGLGLVRTGTQDRYTGLLGHHQLVPHFAPQSPFFSANHNHTLKSADSRLSPRSRLEVGNDVDWWATKGCKFDRSRCVECFGKAYILMENGCFKIEYFGVFISKRGFGCQFGPLVLVGWCPSWKITKLEKSCVHVVLEWWEKWRSNSESTHDCHKTTHYKIPT